MDWLQEMYKCFGQMGLWLAVTTGTAYLAFRFLGARWIENRFATRLEAHKHEQAKELEELRHKINAAFSRVTKIHEKEFEVLPEAWNKLQDTLGRISAVTSLYQQYPDVNRMTTSELAEFVEQSDLSASEKEELLKQGDKTVYYQEKRFRHDLKNAKDSFWDFHNYSIRNRIFLTPDLFEQFQTIDDVMWQAIVLRESGQEDNGHQMWTDAYKKIKDEINPIRDEIERLIQTRLRYHEAE